MNESGGGQNVAGKFQSKPFAGDCRFTGFYLLHRQGCSFADYTAIDSCARLND
jgi:hypothetical protein